MKLFRLLSSVTALAAIIAFAAPAAHAANSGSVASIHGHVNDPLKVPVAGAVVKLTQDHGTIDKGSRFLYSFTTDVNGDYKGTGITAGDYSVVVFQGDKALDFNQSVTFEAGKDSLVDFDMSRQAFIDKMTSDERKTYEEYKKKYAATTADNAQIKNINALLATARNAMDPTKTNPVDPDKAITAMLTATAARPAEPVLWFELGHAYVGAKKYDLAITALQKSIDLNTSAKKVSPDTAGAAYNLLGEADANLGKVPEASAAYEAAAKANPARAAMYYGNEAITLYKAGTTDYANQKADYAGAIAAADKTIAADPTYANAYYVKGQALVGDTTTDASGKIVAPPGCMDAYQNYLKYAPNGMFAPEVKQVLAGFGQTITTSYKAGKH